MSSIKEQLETLVALQSTETEIRLIERDLAGTEVRIETLNTEVQEYEDRFSESQALLDALRKQYRSDENEIKMIDQQIGKSEEKLRSVKTNKEYQSMLKEIDELKLKSSNMEDRMLESLDRIEIIEKETSVKKSDLADVKVEVADKQADILKTAETQRQSLARLKADRDATLEAVPPKLKALYAKVQQQGNGVAVAAIVDAVCQVCRMNIPPQLYNELQRFDEIRMCPNCQRIIYPKALLGND